MKGSNEDAHRRTHELSDPREILPFLNTTVGGRFYVKWGDLDIKTYPGEEEGGGRKDLENARNESPQT